MLSIRRYAGRFAAAVLLTHVLALATAATTAVCCRPAGGAKTQAVPDCCKGEGHFCPLMKKQAPAKADSSMEACPANDERMASLLFGGRGVLVSAGATMTLPRIVTCLESRELRAETRSGSVDTPPPRA